MFQQGSHSGENADPILYHPLWADQDQIPKDGNKTGNILAVGESGPHPV